MEAARYTAKLDKAIKFFDPSWEAGPLDEEDEDSYEEEEEEEVILADESDEGSIVESDDSSSSTKVELRDEDVEWMQGTMKIRIMTSLRVVEI